MAEQASLVQEGVDRFNAAVRSIDEEVQRLQKQLHERRRFLEKQLFNGRKNFEKRTRKQVRRVQSEIRKNSLVKRAESLRADAAKQLENRVDSALAVLHIASKSDVEQIHRKLAQINRKLKEMEQSRKANGGTETV